MSLRLYIGGTQPKAKQARANLRRICEELGDNQPIVDIVDVFREPDRTLSDNIIATPTLVRLSPKPVLRIIGTLSDLPRVRLALGLESAPVEKVKA
ncbi:MAG: circadian clock KaiB family protein [Verrucomicrobiota bacterium]